MYLKYTIKTKMIERTSLWHFKVYNASPKCWKHNLYLISVWRKYTKFSLLSNHFNQIVSTFLVNKSLSINTGEFSYIYQIRK